MATTTTTTTDKTHILLLSYERTHDNNPQENPRFIDDGLMIFTHGWPMTISHYYYYYYYYTNELPESETNKESNWREESKGTTKHHEDGKWKREGREATHSYGNHITWITQRKRRGRRIVYCRAIPDWVLYSRRTHGEGTAAAASEREEEDVVVLLSCVWFPSDNTLFIAATDIQ